MADDVEQVRHEVQFALSQLRVRNGQHEFETLTPDACQSDSDPNLLPATGPVAGGGDQGRDFETFPTQLPGQVQRIGCDLGVPDRAMVGFACTVHTDGNTVNGQLSDERIHHFPGRFACDRLAAARRTTSSFDRAVALAVQRECSGVVRFGL